MSSSNEGLMNSHYNELKRKLLTADSDFEGKSYWKNDGSEPLKNMTVGDLIRESARVHADQIAVSSVHQDKKFTYKELYNQVEQFAAGLVALDVKKGDHMGIWAPNNIEWVVSVMAIIKAGFVAVNLNPLYEHLELHRIMEKSDVKVIIIGDTLQERNFYEILLMIVPELSNHDRSLPLKSKVLTQLRAVITMHDIEYTGAIRWNDISSNVKDCHKNTLQRLEEEISVHDVCNIQFSSGSTGSTKGVCLTHYNIVNNSYFLSKRMMLHEKSHALCLQVPLFHTIGMVIGLLVSVHSGINVVLPSKKFSPTKSIEAIIKEKCTILYGTPTIFIDIITTAKKMAETDPNIFKKMSCLESALTAGAICTPELFKNMKDILGFNHIFSCYGMTETGGAFLSKPTDSIELITTSIGCVMDHTEIKVINESGEIVPSGMPGECCFRGYSIMKCYYKDHEMTDKSMLPGGWLRSGDRFSLTADGYGKIVGRIKDTIIRGGENIEPSEIESVLTNHPDIINAQVFGVHDHRLGEAVVAAVIKYERSQLSENDVKKYCEGKMAVWKIPKYVEFMQNYPQTSSGKVLKFRLRDNFERRYL